MKDFEVYFVYNNTGSNKTETEICNFINEEGSNNCKFLKKCYDKEGRNNRFICLLNKSYVKYVLEEKKFGKDCDFGVVSFKNKENVKIVVPQGKTKGGFFIAINDSQNIQEDKKKFSELMEKFVETGWMYPDTYRIKNLNSDSNFIILTFKKNDNGNYPITFIKKLRALINGMKLESGNVAVRWLNSRYNKSEAKDDVTHLNSVEIAS